MDSSIVFITFVSLVTLTLQALTMRSVRSSSRDQRPDSPIKDRHSKTETNCRDCPTACHEPCSHRSTEKKTPSPPPPPAREFPTSENDAPVHSTTKPRLPVSDPRWQWLSYLKFVKDGKVELQKCDESPLQPDGPFKVFYRSADAFYPRADAFYPRPEGSQLLDTVEVSVTSRSLIRILQLYLRDHGDLKSAAEPIVAGRELYVVLQSLKCHAFEAGDKSSCSNHLDSNDLAPSGSQDADGGNHGVKLGEVGAKEPVTKDDDALGCRYVSHLVRFLEKEYKDLLKRELRMRNEKRVSWDMLWTFLRKGTKVGYYCELSGELLCGKVTGTSYTTQEKKTIYELDSFRERVQILRVELDVYNFNGTRYRKCKISRDIEMFHQEQNVWQLPVCPIEDLGNSSDLEKIFQAKGMKFYELAMKSSNRFMFYEGSMYMKVKENKYPREWELSMEKSDGRVMIDLCSFAAMNPNYPMDSARPPAEWKRGGREFLHTRMNPEEVTSALIFAPAIVYGFSFALKTWGCFAVSRFSDVVFDSQAFQDLVMEPSLKSLVHDLVGQYISDNDPVESLDRVDPIDAKGQGCILLCHGPPGTGKTLTAESVAESMDRPHWALSVSELGTSPGELEKKLLKILKIAAIWKAVLLLDEADVYLEKRTSKANVYHNAMTGVFLRLLEYYRGILFLTTNRLECIDDAFKSRISVFLHYRQLGSVQKGKIWRNLLRRANVEGMSEEFCEKMAHRDLNGREIRNAIHTAQVWAQRKGYRFGVKHIEHVMGELAKSNTVLVEEVSKAD